MAWASHGDQVDFASLLPQTHLIHPARPTLENDQVTVASPGPHQSHLIPSPRRTDIDPMRPCAPSAPARR